MQRISQLQVLDEAPLLKLLSEQQRQEVIGVGESRTLAKGEVLFHEGDQAPAMFALVSGKLKLVRYSPNGKEVLLHLVRPAQTFAEAALFGEGTYPATAEATEKSQVLRLPRTKLLEMIGKDPELGLAFVASMAQWTRRLAAKIDLLTLRRVEERVAIYLLGRAGGRRLGAGDHVELNEPRNLIASQCGTAPEVLSRTFRKLEDTGILRTEGDKVTVLLPEKLYALAEWIE